MVTRTKKQAIAWANAQIKQGDEHGIN
jgi:hypothetical protein